MDVLDAPPFWLTGGDPGPFPLLDEPLCQDWCTCALAATSTATACTCGVAETAAETAAPVGAPAAATPDDVFWATPGVTAPPAGPSPLIADLRSAMDALGEHGPVSGSRADTAALLDLAERARGLALRELAEMDATAGHARPGRTTTTASWLRDEQHLTDGAARAARQAGDRPA